MSGFQPHNHVPADPDAAPARPQRVNRDPPFDFTTILHSHDSHSRTPPHRGEPSFFDEAFRATPSPPPSFLDNILNPISATDPFDQYPQFSAMPPSQRNERSARLRSGFVDLTDDVPDASNSLRRSKRKEATPGPSTKRVKHNDGTALQVDNQAPSATVEKIDLSEDQQDGQDVLQKQRADAVKAQQPPEEKATTFNSFTCVICMDSPTDLTATACGHLFCHTCLMEALIAGENRSGPGEPKRSQCPVCRKVINRSKASDIIPLLLKKGLATQPRKTKRTIAAPQPVPPRRSTRQPTRGRAEPEPKRSGPSAATTTGRLTRSRAEQERSAATRVSLRRNCAGRPSLAPNEI